MKYAVKLHRSRVQKIEEFVWCAVDADNDEDATTTATKFVKENPDTFKSKWQVKAVDTNRAERPRIKCEVFTKTQIDKVPDSVKHIFEPQEED